MDFTPINWHKNNLRKSVQSEIKLKFSAENKLRKKFSHFFRDDRLAAIRGLLYICQGCWMECQSDAECLNQCKINVVLLYRLGVFSSSVELLSIEMEYVPTN
jgi:hypothetical protein